MNDVLRPLQGSGRTIRMLREAVELAEQGRAVYVVAANSFHATLLRNILGKDKAQELGIKFEGCPHDFDWETLRVRGSHPNCVFLVDHHTIEEKFQRILEVLHMYDPSASDLPEKKSSDGKPCKKAITLYAENVAQAHMTVQDLLERGAEVISVCPCPNSKVLNFAIFAQFDPNLVDEDRLWGFEGDGT